MKSLSKHLLEQILAQAGEGLAVIDAGASDWRVEWFNPAFASLTGLPSGALSGHNGRRLLDRLSGPQACEAVGRALAEGRSTELHVARPANAVLVATPLTDKAGAVHCVFTIRSNAQHAAGKTAPPVETGGEEIARPAAEPSEKATRIERDDLVTGLLKRVAFEEVLEHDLAIARRETHSMIVLAFRVDAWDEYLATFGRHAADAALRKVAQALRRRLRRASDVAGRIGAHTLAVVVHGGEEAAALDFAGQIATEVRDLNIHHPRSPLGRYLTVTPEVRLLEPRDTVPAAALLDTLA